MPAGRPLKFKSVEKLQKKIDEYFESCWAEVVIGVDKEGNVVRERRQVKPYTVSGLASYLDTNRQTLINYEEKEDFFDTIARAKAKIEAFTEEQLFTPKIANGVAFNLKNNFGWRDKTEQEISGPNGGPIQISRVSGMSDEELEDILNENNSE